MTVNGFKSKIISSIRIFVEKYGIDFYINEEDEAENILNNLLKAFEIQKRMKKYMF